MPGQAAHKVLLAWFNQEVTMRRILAPLCEPDLDRHALEQATKLGSKLNARVTALLPLTDFASLPVYGHYPLTAGWDELVQHLHGRAERREAEVRQLLREMRPAGDADAPVTLRVQYGNDDAVVSRAALTHDLVVFARPASEDEDLPASSLLKTTLESSGRPVLVVTGDLAPDFARTVAIAWNGSVEAAHAVTAALPLITRAETVHVLTFATSRTDASAADDLIAYLACHGVEAQAHVDEPEMSVGEELLMETETLSANLIVMGGYTHSRIRQTLFGGVTHYMLENGHVPLLMAR
jgi:nucleotide-binding universal stress UspA family protein